jgi:hypothetical protein
LAPRPESRVGNDFEPPRRWQSVGKIDTSQWETKIRDASPHVSTYQNFLFFLISIFQQTNNAY